MKRTIALLSLAVVASAAFAGTIPKPIKARYTALATTLRKLDLKTFDTYFDSGFVSVDPQGKSTSKIRFLCRYQADVRQGDPGDG